MMKKIQNKKHILLVDDDESIVQMLRLLLESRGYRVTLASNGEQALRKLNRSIDLVLLDIILPDQGGFDVCRKIKEDKDHHTIPIILLSAKLLPENIVEGLYLGADDYLTKPFAFEELVARIEAVYRRNAPFRKESYTSKGDEAIVQELRAIIDEERVVPFFQPIIQLKPFKIIGFEAFCRPKTKTMLANPDVLFKAAMSFGFYQEMESLAWRKAIEVASKNLTDEQLFLNCNPYFVEGPRSFSITDLFKSYNINVGNVVLEITERTAISDYKAFYQHLKIFREHGFKFAVDDVGGGYASLESIVHTKPEVVKIDCHIINNIHNDTYKKSIVKFIVAFCKENSILCIAEGIEIKEDLETLIGLGVDGGQGYYLSKPSPEISLEEVQSLQKKEALLSKK